jgi:hypothetical protein
MDLYRTIPKERLWLEKIAAGLSKDPSWTMSGSFNGTPFSAPGMSIVKFVDDILQSYYSRDYYTEGDIMTGVPEVVLGFRAY